MMADEAPNNADDDSDEKAGEAAAKKDETADAAAEKKDEAAAKKKDESAEPEKEAEPDFDPDTCRAIAIGLDAFWEGVHSGEWTDSDLEYYLEPAGVMNGPLRCTRAPEEDPQRAGLLMTRAGWKAKKVALDDELNPDTYELSFPKEFGYVKPLAHYVPETYEHAKYPWSKKY